MSILEPQQGYDTLNLLMHRDTQEQEWVQVENSTVSYLILKVNLSPSTQEHLDRSGMPVLRGDVKGGPTILHQIHILPSNENSWTTIRLGHLNSKNLQRHKLTRLCTSLTLYCISPISECQPVPLYPWAPEPYRYARSERRSEGQSNQTTPDR